MKHFYFSNAKHNGFSISTDPSKLDMDFIHQFLSEESYWAKGSGRDDVEASLEGELCYGVYENGNQIGFASVTSDFSSFAYISDVFIHEKHRGKGFSKWLMESILSHPGLNNLSEWMLITDSAYGLYEKFGFKRVPGSADQMVKVNPKIGM